MDEQDDASDPDYKVKNGSEPQRNMMELPNFIGASSRAKGVGSRLLGNMACGLVKDLSVYYPNLNLPENPSLVISRGKIRSQQKKNILRTGKQSFEGNKCNIMGWKAIKWFRKGRVR